MNSPYHSLVNLSQQLTYLFGTLLWMTRFPSLYHQTVKDRPFSQRSLSFSGTYRQPYMPGDSCLAMPRSTWKHSRSIVYHCPLTQQQAFKGITGCRVTGWSIYVILTVFRIGAATLAKKARIADRQILKCWADGRAMHTKLTLEHLDRSWQPYQSNCVVTSS